ncbi:hypothetical protein [Nocardia cyriacigeorgica]|uniref:Uncharacterized protein n=1 Tax=Nocardia cyriacigeorgica (strain GUH-2) TaxID=1127134 RepID=H6R0J7_NOCCG|nr:hypothetical protein [Nocardia cyriacigeorgica]BDT89129.1 hypothetical protein FMUAM8_48930 [Nocardia cyriacigeorgica]CCF65466.1 conserved protein of unknown function [Nocardia cyriacigeorgica GUH-2]
MTDSGLTIEHPLPRALTTLGPAGWHRLDAEFAVTVRGEIANLVYSVGEQRVAVLAPEQVLALVRQLRAAAADSTDGPWWRLLLTLTESGAVTVEYDYGADPFPPEQMFETDAYRADLVAYPRAHVPVWLAAYMLHADRQQRTPQQAAEQARDDRADQVWAVLADNEFPPFPVMWARWATLSAAFVAARSPWGPRVLPWTGVFEGAARGGSTLHVLPGGRAVLSGGVWNAPALDAAYNGDAPLPRVYAGAPEWVANPVLNARASSGLLSFCYWWEGGRWYRGESPSADECATAVPGVWTAEIVAEIVGGLAEPAQGAELAATLVAAAEAGVVTRETLTAVFDETRFDIDGALYQLGLAGVVSTLPDELPEAAAIARVRDHILTNGLDTTGYPLSELTAHRLSMGWMVYVPVPEGQISIGRAIFYVADDGVLEQSSSSVAPGTYIAGFEQRFTDRHRPLVR